MRIDAVMVAWNQPGLCLQSILHILALTPAEVRFIIVDNGSDEPIGERLASWLGNPHIFIRSDKNVGPYRALNQALRLVETDHIIICDTDHFAMPHWFEWCWQALQQYPNFVWASTNPYPSTGTIADRLWDSLAPVSDGLHAIQGELGVSLGVMDWKRVREQVGYYDERFHIAHGDTDWYERMEDAGFHWAMIEEARSRHLGGMSWRLIDPIQMGTACWADAMTFREKWKDHPRVREKNADLWKMTEADVRCLVGVRYAKIRAAETGEPIGEYDHLVDEAARLAGLTRAANLNNLRALCQQHLPIHDGPSDEAHVSLDVGPLRFVFGADGKHCERIDRLDVGSGAP